MSENSDKLRDTPASSPPPVISCPENTDLDPLMSRRTAIAVMIAATFDFVLCACGFETPPPFGEKEKSIAPALQKILNKKSEDVRKEIDLEVPWGKPMGEICLDIENKDGGAQKENALYNLRLIVDSVIGELRTKKLDPLKDVDKILLAIYDALEKFGFEYDSDPNESHYFQDALIPKENGKRKYSCYHKPIIIAQIAEQMNLPIKVVVALIHVFCRWDKDGKHDALRPDALVNNGDKNLETTSKVLPSDQDEIDEINKSGQKQGIAQITQIGIENGSSMGTLSREQLVAMIYVRRVEGILLKNERLTQTILEKLLNDLKKAELLFPQLPQIYFYFGIILKDLNLFDLALSYFNRALSYEPGFLLATKQIQEITSAKKGTIAKPLSVPASKILTYPDVFGEEK